MTQQRTPDQSAPNDSSRSALSTLHGIKGWVATINGKDGSLLSYFRGWLRRRVPREDNAASLGYQLGWQQRRGWRQVALEVRLRKSLILDAAEDLGMGIKALTAAERSKSLFRFELDRTTTQIPTAQIAPNEPTTAPRRSLPPELIPANVIVMAATDVFVEKAQRKLGQRARILVILGSLIALVSVGLLLWASYHLLGLPLSEAFHSRELERAKHYNQVLTLILVRSLTVSALFLGAVYFLVMITRALLHEAMVLFGRRHSLRFGRLYVYSKLGHVNFEDMQRAFGWNSEHHSAFADIRGDKVSKSLVQAIADVAKEVAKATATAVTEAAKPGGAGRS